MTDNLDPIILSLRRFTQFQSGICLGLIFLAFATQLYWIVLLGAFWLVFLPDLRKSWNLAHGISFFRLVLFGLTLLLPAEKPWFIFQAGILFLVLDGLDGFIARKLRTTSLVGGQLDMEADAIALLWLGAHLVINGSPGWLMIPASLRYLYVAFHAVFLRVPAPECRRPSGRWIFLGVFVSMLALAVYNSPQTIGFVAIMSLLLCGSFFQDLKAHLTVVPEARRYMLKAMGWFACLNLIMFVPWWLAAAINDQAEVIALFSPNHQYGSFGPDLSSLWQMLLQVFVRRFQPDVFRLSIELIAASIVAFLWIRRGFATAAEGLFAIIFGLLFLNESYEAIIQVAFNRPAVFVDDLPILRNGLKYLGSFTDFKLLGLAALLGLLLVAFSWFCLTMIRNLAKNISAAPKLSANTRAGLICFFASAAISALHFGISHKAPIFQWQTTKIAQNIQHSIFRLEESPKIDEAIKKQRFDTMQLLGQNIDKNAKRPNVWLWVMESYGGILRYDALLANAFDGLMKDQEVLLNAYEMLSFSSLSESPVFGGMSWLATAEIHTGLSVPNSYIYERIGDKKADIETLPSAMQQLGYLTLSVQPGTYETNNPLNNLYRFQHTMTQKDLNYLGKKIGWGGVPDGFSFNQALHKLHELESTRHFVEFKGVSTHSPWPMVAPISRRVAELGKHLTSAKLDYFRTLAYEWEVIQHLVASTKGQPTMIFIIGDHEPYIADRKSRSAILQVLISKNAASPPCLDHIKNFGKGLNPDTLLKSVQASKNPQGFHHYDLFRLIINMVKSSNHGDHANNPSQFGGPTF